MVIVKVMGGLGNQMFQSALYRRFEVEGKEVYMDLSHIKKYGDSHNGYELERIFGLKYQEAPESEMKRLANLQLTYWGRFKRKIGGIRKATHYLEQTYEYKPQILQNENIYLEGYWQTEKYFIDIRKTILKDFIFPGIVDERNKEIIESIDNSNSVGIHVRRGDYLQEENLESRGGICTVKYYQEAVRHIKKYVSEPVFYIFSDDMEWVKENLEVGNAVFINWNHKNDSYRDMQLMSRCKCQIIANSTFSWWAAWLNQNPQKIVVTPSKWMNGKGNPDILCEGWVKMNGDG